MARPRSSPFTRELRSARKTLAKVRAFDPTLDNRWVAGMVRYWEGRVRVLEAVVKSQRSAD